MDSQLTPGAYRTLGSVAGVIGLSASCVATWFFILGLLQTEQDGAARAALIAAGVLLTVGQLASFGLAALLPEHIQRRLRGTLLALGTCLFLFEVGTMAVTQLALVQSADAAADASTARIGELQRAIENRRAVAADRRDLAATQTQAQAITAAARTLRLADEAEGAIAPLASELAQLQAARRPTLTTLLGNENTALFATIRSALIALVGLVFMSAAGALFRVARGMQVARSAYQSTTAELECATGVPIGRRGNGVGNDQVHGTGEPLPSEPHRMPPTWEPQRENRRLHASAAHREPRRGRSRDRPSGVISQPR